MTRAVLLVDGEHYPPVIAAAIDEVSARGVEVLGAVFLGGSEKIASASTAQTDLADALGIPVIVGPSPRETLKEAYVGLAPDTFIDLSDSPVIDSPGRFDLASLALALGASYEGPGYRLEPPPRPRCANRPSIAVIGTGKRTGKTAVCAAMTRFASLDHNPLVVAMGRGGPELPEVIRPTDQVLTPQALLAWADAGRHAASDHIEDALFTGATTVGTRRCGGGLAGEVGPNNFIPGVERAVVEADKVGHDLFFFEGSGASIPPAAADVTLLVIPASASLEDVTGFLGPYRVLLSDAVVIVGEKRRGVEIKRAVEEIASEVEIVTTDLEPAVDAETKGRRVAVATTAGAEIAGSAAAHLAAKYGCEIVGVSRALANRDALEADLGRLLGKCDLLVTELKGAAVDVAVRMAVERGVEVAFLDNVPTASSEVAGLTTRLVELAESRFAQGAEG